MERSLELYGDGRLSETQDGLVIKIIETHGQVDALITALQLSTAKTWAIASSAFPSEQVARRGTRGISAAGLQLLTTFEGCRTTAYDDGRGVWTIGYGHTAGVYPGMTITQAEAEQWLTADLAEFESNVSDAVQVPLNDNQFAALVCFCFNVGPGADGFGGSTLLKLLNQGNYAAAANQFPRWNKVEGQPWLGLTRRRLAERSLFLGQPWQPFLTYEGSGEEFIHATEESIDNSQPIKPRILKLLPILMQGEDVRQVQAALQKAGFSLQCDGFFGQETEQAVRQFQQQKGLMVDGQVGTATRTALGLA
jgi:lysozyme